MDSVRATVPVEAGRFPILTLSPLMSVHPEADQPLNVPKLVELNTVSIALWALQLSSYTVSSTAGDEGRRGGRAVAVTVEVVYGQARRECRSGSGQKCRYDNEKLENRGGAPRILRGWRQRTRSSPLVSGRDTNIYPSFLVAIQSVRRRGAAAAVRIVAPPRPWSSASPTGPPNRTRRRALGAHDPRANDAGA